MPGSRWDSDLRPLTVAHMHTQAHTHTHTHAHTHAHTQSHARTSVHTQTHAHSHRHTHTHIHNMPSIHTRLLTFPRYVEAGEYPHKPRPLPHPLHQGYIALPSRNVCRSAAGGMGATALHARYTIETKVKVQSTECASNLKSSSEIKSTSIAFAWLALSTCFILSVRRRMRRSVQEWNRTVCYCMCALLFRLTPSPMRAQSGSPLTQGPIRLTPHP